MRTLNTKDLKKISGGKDANDFYHEIVKPLVLGGGGIIAGFGGGIAAAIVIHGIEGFVQAAPDAMKALEQINKISDAQLAKIMQDPYGYPD